VVERQFVRQDELGDVISAVFGSSRRLVEMVRLAGGSKKGVYRLALDDGCTSILYVWSESENYWPASQADPSGAFADASGVDLFVAGHTRLEALGVRAPFVYVVDTSHRDYPADFAVVEDVRGGTLEDLIGRSPAAAGAALEELGVMLAAMHRHRSPSLGKLALVEAGTAPEGRSADQVVLDQALRHLTVAAGRVARLAEAKDSIEERVQSLAAAVAPRHGYGLIHGELGPDHVLIADDGRPVLIDIEGLMFFDIEWEHAFLRMRFGSQYEPLRVSGLDPARLRFYEFAQSLSLIEGPLRIADGDFPDRDFMVKIATWHTDKVLRLAQLPL
jgi:tRNA A-37 threonylcarbamoyl transferase component Bud32